jgi:endogenous inhibitor of DNA gyrase (YacG/DUF329 family)
MNMPVIVNCPTCETKVEWTDAFPCRPFCSDRCKQIDFGDWATERFSIAGEPCLDPSKLGEDDES